MGRRWLEAFERGGAAEGLLGGRWAGGAEGGSVERGAEGGGGLDGGLPFVTSSSTSSTRDALANRLAVFLANMYSRHLRWPSDSPASRGTVSGNLLAAVGTWSIMVSA